MTPMSNLHAAVTKERLAVTRPPLLTALLARGCKPWMHLRLASGSRVASLLIKIS